MSEAQQRPERVIGERGRASVTRTASWQSRLGNLLAIGFMSLMGLGGLSWYYAHALTRTDRAKLADQAAAARRAQGDAPLPSLGKIDLGAAFAPNPPVSADPTPLLQPGLPLQELPLSASTAPAMAAPPREKTGVELALERRLGGSVYAAPLSPHAAERETDGPGGEHTEGPLAAMLQPTSTVAVRARKLPTRRLLLPKGSFVDCTLETAIDSGLPGMTTCVTATDTFGADGSVVLMERGTKLVGETRGEVAQGGSRVFVLWTEARTPAGVIVPLDSPGADELGRSGLPGEVNRHFWQRFGAAILVSVIDGAVQAAAQSARTGGEVIINPTSSETILTDILKGTINIPPTVTKRNGDRIQVLVARDLDFRAVYELRPVASGR